MASSIASADPELGTPEKLVAFALARLISRQAPAPAAVKPPAACDPLVVVAADRTPASAWLASVMDQVVDRDGPRSSGGRIAVWEGSALGRSLAAAGAAAKLHHDLSTHRLVVIDHADEVGGGERQRALVHLLDALRAAGIGTCLSVASPPADAPHLEPQLASRLAGGLVVILPASPRPPAGEPAHAARRPVSLGRVFSAVARHEQCSRADLLGPSRCRTLAQARSLAMYVARTVTGRSFHAIGVACGGRDHTTVLHAMKVVRRRLAHDAAFAAEVARLVRRLSAPSPQPVRCRKPVGTTASRPPAPRRQNVRPASHSQMPAARQRAISHATARRPRADD